MVRDKDPNYIVAESPNRAGCVIVNPKRNRVIRSKITNRMTKIISEAVSNNAQNRVTKNYCDSIDKYVY